MRTATCLALVAIGAILTFAVTGSPSHLNLQIAGVIVMATGVAGLFLRKPRNGWLRRRTVLRRSAGGPVAGHVDETRYPPYVMLNPGASQRENNGAQPGDLTTPHPAAETIPDLPAEVVTVDGDSVVEEDVEEEYVDE